MNPDMIPLLRKELEFITNNPKLWDQGSWWRTTASLTACGTKGCLAGNAINNSTTFALKKFAQNDSDVEYDYYPVRIVDNSPESWRAAGAEVLGLAPDEAMSLFGSENSLWRLWYLAHQFSNGDIEIPPGVEPTPTDALYAYAYPPQPLS